MMRGPPPANRRVRALSLEQLSPEKLPLLEKERRRQKEADENWPSRHRQADSQDPWQSLDRNTRWICAGPLLGKEFCFEIKLVSFRIHRRCFCNRVFLR